MLMFEDVKEYITIKAIIITRQKYPKSEIRFQLTNFLNLDSSINILYIKIIILFYLQDLIYP